MVLTWAWQVQIYAVESICALFCVWEAKRRRRARSDLVVVHILRSRSVFLVIALVLVVSRRRYRKRWCLASSVISIGIIRPGSGSRVWSIFRRISFRNCLAARIFRKLNIILSRSWKTICVVALRGPKPHGICGTLFFSLNVVLSRSWAVRCVRFFSSGRTYCKRVSVLLVRNAILSRSRVFLLCVLRMFLTNRDERH